MGRGRADHGLYLSYVQTLDHAAALSGRTLDNLLNLLAFALGRQGALIEAVAGGELTHADLMETVEKDHPIAPVGDPPSMRAAGDAGAGAGPGGQR